MNIIEFFLGIIITVFMYSLGYIQDMSDKIVDFILFIKNKIIICVVVEEINKS